LCSEVKMTLEINFKDHPEYKDSGLSYFNYDNLIPEEIVPRGDVKTPYKGPYSFTEEDLKTLVDNAKTLVDKTLYKYNPAVAFQDALNRSIRDFHNGLFDGKINASTYQLLLNSLGLKDVSDDKKSKKASEEELMEHEASKKTPDIVVTPRGSSKQVVIPGKTLRQIVQGKPTPGRSTLDKNQVKVQEEPKDSPKKGKKMSSITEKLDVIASKLEELGSDDMIRLAFQLDQVSDALQAKEAATLESDKDESYMKTHFSPKAIETDSDEKFMKEFNTDTTEEVERVKTEKSTIKKASLPYQKISG